MHPIRTQPIRAIIFAAAAAVGVSGCSTRLTLDKGELAGSVQVGSEPAPASYPSPDEHETAQPTASPLPPPAQSRPASNGATLP